MSVSRRTLQRTLLTILGALLLMVGVRALSAGPSHAERHIEHRVEHRIVLTSATAEATDVFYDETFRVREGGQLVVDLGSSAVDVRTVSGDRARVIIEGDGRDAASEFERRRFSARERGGDLTVRTDPPRRQWSRRTDARFQVTIEIPRRYSASIDVGSGSVEVARLDGDLTVDTGSGSVRVADVTGGRIVLDTGSGSVQAGRLRGDVRIDTGSGSVSVDGVDGDLSVDTGSGRVAVGLVRGEAEVSTGSGSVELTLDSAGARVGTGSGSITVRVPRGAAFDLDAEGSRVRLDDGLSFSGSRERDEARGRIGRGGPDLRLRAGSGTVRVVAD